MTHVISFIFSQGEGKQKSQIISLQVMTHCTNKIRILLCFLIFRLFLFLVFCIFYGLFTIKNYIQPFGATSFRRLFNLSSENTVQTKSFSTFMKK